MKVSGRLLHKTEKSTRVAQIERITLGVWVSDGSIL